MAEAIHYAQSLTPFRFPKEGVVLSVELKDQGHELLSEDDTKQTELVPILGLLQTRSHVIVNRRYDVIEDDLPNEIDGNEPKKEKRSPGRLVVYGDSNCIDDSHQQKRDYTFYLYRSNVFESQNLSVNQFHYC